MTSVNVINVTKFERLAFDTAQLYVSKKMWYYILSSVYKVLIHGENVIRHYSMLPLGQLPEDAQEDYKCFRLYHAGKHSRIATNEDILNFCILRTLST